MQIIAKSNLDHENNMRVYFIRQRADLFMLFRRVQSVCGFSYTFGAILCMHLCAGFQVAESARCGQ